MVKIVGVKFNHTCKIYYFDPKDIQFKKGEGVIVETVRGTEYGKVVIENKEVPDDTIVQPLKPVTKKASKKDEEKIEEHEKKIPWIIDVAQKEIEKCGLDMKIVDAEFPFDNSKIIIYFTAPSRIDFRDLVKSLATELHHRIDLRQIGTRDEAKLLGGLAPCGRVCCCKSFLPDFKKVTIKMAKNQGLSLNPAKISGLCGRLMCCLEYENDYYADACKKVPKLGGTVGTPEGEGVVISNDMLKMISKVKITKGDGSEVYKDFPVERLTFKKANKPEKDDDEKIIDEDMKKILD